MVLKFGTDGLRGVAGAELTPEVALALGRAAARVFAHPAPAPESVPPATVAHEAPGTPAQGTPASPACPFVVGRDTRLSGPMLQAALCAGLAAQGVEVVDVGVIPTPGVAAVCAEHGWAGAVVSASHNPFADNGIKLFAPGGRKLDDATEAKVEAALGAALADPLGHSCAAGRALGRIGADSSASGWYGHKVASALEGRRLEGISVVLDCANGAACEVAPKVLADLGAEVVEVLGATPDGSNINAGCGSTEPEALARAVLVTHADVGLAFDGDADRVIAVDAAGRVVDGDRLLALFARDLEARGRLRGSTVVVSVMTNLGFHLAMDAAGIAVEQTAVGDRYVLDALDAGGWSLGGEQSGHIVFKDLATTGDGLLSGVMLLDLVSRRGTPLFDLAESSMERLPQVLRNVAVSERESLAGAEPVWAEVASVEARLGSTGRVLLRASGTERVVRVMVEAASEADALDAADRLEAAVRASLGQA